MKTKKSIQVEGMDGLGVVAKKNGKFYAGRIKDGKIVNRRHIKKLSALRRRDDYITLNAYLKATAKKDRPSVILMGLRVERLYVLPQNLHKTSRQNKNGGEKLHKQLENMPTTERSWEKVFWAKYHPTCVPCTKNCKQSHLILDIYCPSRTV